MITSRVFLLHKTLHYEPGHLGESDNQISMFFYNYIGMTFFFFRTGPKIHSKLRNANMQLHTSKILILSYIFISSTNRHKLKYMKVETLPIDFILRWYTENYKPYISE